MSKGKRSRPSVPPAPVRSRQRSGNPAQSLRNARRRWWSWGLGGTILVAVIAVIVAAAGSGTSYAPGGAGTAGTSPSAHAVAPDGSFTTTAGATETVASLHGQPTLLWFVTTWCSSCQAGTQAMSAQIPTLATHHVRVVEVELAGD